jgi:mevalonate kinase
MSSIVGRAPGRICLLGDNADLLEEPAIAAAISAYLSVEIEPRSGSEVRLVGHDISVTETFRTDDALTLDSPLKYVKAVYARFKDKLTGGFDLSIRSDIPVSAGLSSSTALSIAAIRAMGRLAHVTMSPAEVAELSFQIERYDLDIECGRMDQYAIAFGGVNYIHTGNQAGVERLPLDSLPIVVADTRENHDTQALQKWLRRRIADDDPRVVEPLRRVVVLVKEGKDAILHGDLVGLGSIMTAQQTQELAMGTSTERLELFCRTALKAGAWGAKQMGAGGGGCTVALAEPSKLDLVAGALRDLGAPVWTYDVHPPEDEM